MLKVVAAAIRMPYGTIWSVPAPGRHHDVNRKIVDAGGSVYMVHPDNQGFLLSDGTFANRMKAFQIALNAGQIVEGQPGLCPRIGLFSEDLW